MCCEATSFEASEDFAFDKPAGSRCRFLRRDCRCGIHPELAARGMSGCAIYDCYGAGQRVTRAFAHARDATLERNEAFLRLRVVHELLWLLTEAAQRCAQPELESELAAEIEALDAFRPETLLEAELHAHEQVTRALLRRVGAALGGRRLRAPSSP